MSDVPELDALIAEHEADKQLRASRREDRIGCIVSRILGCMLFAVVPAAVIAKWWALLFIVPVAWQLAVWLLPDESSRTTCTGPR